MTEDLPSMFSADVIVPVLLHRGRMRQRRFNQVKSLADAMREPLGLPVLAEDVRRVIATVPQIELIGAERRRNVRGVFSATGGATSEEAGIRVLLVDDVFTTGSALANAALALKRAGARSVHGLAFTHEPRLVPDVAAASLAAHRALA
jgi:predicted amidophosphoribosyltransferase